MSSGITEPLADSVEVSGQNDSTFYDYSPWVPPFTYDPQGTFIADSRGRQILDIRGWGFLTGKGHEALGLHPAKATVIQDEIGEYVTKLLNLTSVGRGGDKQSAPPVSPNPDSLS